jgi:hypothetical protein
VITEAKEVRVAPNGDLSRALWRKSTHSNNGGACIEVATNLPGIVAVRDSKNQSGPVLVIGSESWHVLTSKIRAGEFGL